MKIIHTSDWHLGHTLYGYDRTEEQRYMLGQIESLAVEHRPDALLVSGDVFHTTSPSATVQRMFVEAMMRLHAAVPEMQVVVTAGNHDSATRHEVFRQPWATLNIHTIGSVERGHETDCIVELPGKGFIVAVPYVNEHYLNDDFYPSLLAAVGERNTASLPVVLMAHATVTSDWYAGAPPATPTSNWYAGAPPANPTSDWYAGAPPATPTSDLRPPTSDLSVGGIDASPLSFFGEGYDYLALGHIHHAQTLQGSDGRARYCGTPLPVSFDEAGEHSVTLVEIDNHGDTPKLTVLPIDNPHPLQTLPEEGYATWDEALRLLQQVDADNAAYLRLNVEVDDFLPVGANAEAAQTVKDKACRFCFINARRRERERTQSVGLTVSEFRRESPLSLVQRYAADKGMPFDDELAELFNSIS